MNLSLDDMRAVLKTRAERLTNMRKAINDPADLIAGVKDCQVVLKEIEEHAEELARIKEQLELEEMREKDETN